jgi:hypothetical protein
MYYNYYNRNENNVVLSIQLANGRVGILAQMGYYIFAHVLCCFTSEHHNNCYAGSGERHLSELTGQKSELKQK